MTTQTATISEKSKETIDAKLIPISDGSIDWKSLWLTFDPETQEQERDVVLSANYNRRVGDQIKGLIHYEQSLASEGYSLEGAAIILSPEITGSDTFFRSGLYNDDRIMRIFDTTPDRAYSPEKLGSTSERLNNRIRTASSMGFDGIYFCDEGMPGSHDAVLAAINSGISLIQFEMTGGFGSRYDERTMEDALSEGAHIHFVGHAAELFNPNPRYSDIREKKHLLDMMQKYPGQIWASAYDWLEILPSTIESGNLPPSQIVFETRGSRMGPDRFKEPLDYINTELARYAPEIIHRNFQRMKQAVQ